MYHESYKVQAVFFFRFCDVANQGHDHPYADLPKFDY